MYIWCYKRFIFCAVFVSPSPYFPFFKVPEKCSCCDCTSHKISVIEWHWMLSARALHCSARKKRHIHVDEYRHAGRYANKETTKAQCCTLKRSCTLQSLSITFAIFALGKSFHCSDCFCITFFLLSVLLMIFPQLWTNSFMAISIMF